MSNIARLGGLDNYTNNISIYNMIRHYSTLSGKRKAERYDSIALNFRESE
jgi:hypothetical protein